MDCSNPPSSLGSGSMPQPCSDVMVARSWPHCSKGWRRQNTPCLSSSSRPVAAPRRAKSHSTVPPSGHAACGLPDRGCRGDDQLPRCLVVCVQWPFCPRHYCSARHQSSRYTRRAVPLNKASFSAAEAPAAMCLKAFQSVPQPTAIFSTGKLLSNMQRSAPNFSMQVSM
jgi:hypothetical protein